MIYVVLVWAVAATAAALYFAYRAKLNAALAAAKADVEGAVDKARRAF